MGFKYEMEQRLNLTNAFGGTFVFFSKAQTNAKNPKEPPSQRTTSLHTMNETTTTDERAACNRRLAKKRVQWLIEHSTSYQLLCWFDGLVLRNPLLRQAPKRWR